MADVKSKIIGVKFEKFEIITSNNIDKYEGLTRNEGPVFINVGGNIIEINSFVDTCSIVFTVSNLLDENMEPFSVGLKTNTNKKSITLQVNSFRDSLMRSNLLLVELINVYTNYLESIKFEMSNDTDTPSLSWVEGMDKNR